MDEESSPDLNRFERAAVSLLRFANETPAKRLQKPFHQYFSRHWVYLTIARRVFVDRIERLLDLNPDRGVLLCSNHRSFFDMYITMLAMFTYKCEWIERIYFPVRSNFFYERPIGMFLNLAVGGGAMYPPIFRDPAKSAHNADALDRLKQFLSLRGTIVGMHPEGTRNKTDDPYTLLPAQAGVGQILLHAKPICLPMFINGVGNDFLGDIRVNYTRGAHIEHPVILTFGEPMDYSEFTAKKPRIALYKKSADKINEAIAALGPRDKQLREQIRNRELDHDPRWLHRTHKNGA
jgi:1-acyl-sn-glycerol-3-phosphate acyltransferase